MLDLKNPFPERNLLPRRGLSQCGISDQAVLPRHAPLGVTQTPCGSHVLLAHVTTLATVPPPVVNSAALGQPAQSVQEGHAEAVKKSVIKITQETPHTKAGNSRENTSHAGSGVAARCGGTSP